MIFKKIICLDCNKIFSLLLFTFSFEEAEKQSKEINCENH
jgi:hypothetical protein